MYSLVYSLLLAGTRLNYSIYSRLQVRDRKQRLYHAVVAACAPMLIVLNL